MHPGDDFEEHDKVANGLPADLPDVELWRNKIKDARLKRNEADYEPFMSSDPQFKSASAATLRVADDFFRVCLTYLRSKGCYSTRLLQQGISIGRMSPVGQSQKNSA
jgi:hypothetical protein